MDGEETVSGDDGGHDQLPGQEHHREHRRDLQVRRHKQDVTQHQNFSRLIMGSGFLVDL